VQKFNYKGIGSVPPRLSRRALAEEGVTAAAALCVDKKPRRCRGFL